MLLAGRGRGLIIEEGMKRMNEELSRSQAPALRRKGLVSGCGWEEARPQGTVRNEGALRLLSSGINHPGKGLVSKNNSILGGGYLCFLTHLSN